VRNVGIAASVVMALLILGVLYMFVRSIPDIARYLRLRKM
jgi:hypothetical protein